VLPEGVEKVKHRSDTAGYQHDLLRYCEKGDNDRFGRIEFAIGCNVTRAFKIAVTEVPGSEWQPIYKDYTEKKTNAEVCSGSPSWTRNNIKNFGIIFLFTIHKVFSKFLHFSIMIFH